MAQDSFTPTFDFEFHHEEATPEMLDHACRLTPSSDLACLNSAPCRATGTAAADEAEMTTFALTKASPGNSFGETLGRGKGPSHGLGFRETSDNLDSRPELLEPDPLAPLASSRDRSTGEPDR